MSNIKMIKCKRKTCKNVKKNKNVKEMLRMEKKHF